MDFAELRISIQTPCDKAAYLSIWEYNNRTNLIPEPIVRVVLDNPRVNNGTWIGESDGFGLKYAGEFTQMPRHYQMTGTVCAQCGGWRIEQKKPEISGWLDYNTNDINHCIPHVHIDGTRIGVSLYDNFSQIMDWLGQGMSSTFTALLQANVNDYNKLWTFEGHQSEIYQREQYDG